MAVEAYQDLDFRHDQPRLQTEESGGCCAENALDLMPATPRRCEAVRRPNRRYLLLAAVGAGNEGPSIYRVISPASRRLRRVALNTSSKGGSAAICWPRRTDQSFL
jgi:hypothetical protein